MKQDFLDAVSSLVGRLMEDSIHTSAPSKVGKVENNHTAKLTPNLKVTTDDGREVPYPEISGTIILMPCGAGGTVGFAFPVKSDDGCLALFNEGGSGTDLKWDLSNAALLPGLYQSPGEQVKKAGSEEAAIMFAPSSTITVTKDKIEIKKDDTKITVTSDSIKMEKGSTTVTASMWGDRIFEKCGIGRDERGDGGKTLEIRGKRRLPARDGGANYQQS